MIDASILPGQILVIDDNQEWLSVVRALKINVLCCKGITTFDIYQCVQNHIDAITTVVLNANMVSQPNESRISFLGNILLEDILKNHFPHLKYILLSFTYSKNEQKQITNYIDFLNYLNLCNGK